MVYLVDVNIGMDVIEGINFILCDNSVVFVGHWDIDNDFFETF